MTDPADRLQAALDAPGNAGPTFHEEDVRAVLAELNLYRSAARYNVAMGGPIFTRWDLARLVRARAMTEAATCG